MTKENWIKHMEEISGLIRPSFGGSQQAWIDFRNGHKSTNCPICKDRAKTKRANSNRKAKEDVYRSCGLTKVIGSVSGSVYWE